MCLEVNQGLWVLPLRQAKEIFGVSNKELKKVPVMMSMPGRYCVRNQHHKGRRLRLACVAHVKLEALKLHGATNVLLKRLDDGLIPQKYIVLARWLLKAPLQRLQFDPLEIPEGYLPIEDAHCGMASVRFPHMTCKTTIEHGLWCYACQFMFNRSILGTYDYLSEENWRRNMHIVRPRTEFFEHIKACEGAKILFHYQSSPYEAGL